MKKPEGIADIPKTLQGDESLDNSESGGALETPQGNNEAPSNPQELANNEGRSDVTYSLQIPEGFGSPESCEDYEPPQAEGEPLESSQNPESISIDEFEKVKASGPVHLRDLIEPLIGTYTGSEQGMYSPYYCIQTQKGVVRVIGVKDLQSKMAEVEIGKVVRIKLDGTKVTSNGYTMQIADVCIKKES